MKLILAIIKPFKLDEVREANMVPKVKIELVCDDALAPRVVETLRQSAGTGSIGDGKIFVLDVGQAVRIRTGETGEAAL